MRGHTLGCDGPTVRYCRDTTTWPIEEKHNYDGIWFDFFFNKGLKKRSYYTIRVYAKRVNILYYICMHRIIIFFYGCAYTPRIIPYHEKKGKTAILNNIQPILNNVFYYYPLIFFLNIQYAYKKPYCYRLLCTWYEVYRYILRMLHQVSDLCP